MIKHFLPKKIFPYIPPKPQKIIATYASPVAVITKLPQLHESSASLYQSESSKESKKLAGTLVEESIYEDIDFSQNNTQTEIIVSTAEYCIDKQSYEITRGSSSICNYSQNQGLLAVQCPDADKYSEIPTGFGMTTVSESSNQTETELEIESITNTIGEDEDQAVSRLEVGVAINVVDENNSVAEPEIASSINEKWSESSSIEITCVKDNPNPKQTMKITTKSLPIRPEVEGMNKEEQRNSEGFVIEEIVKSSSTKPVKKIETFPKVVSASAGIKFIQMNSNGNAITIHNNITTIEIDSQQKSLTLQPPPPTPLSVIHHVINLPPRRANSIKRRRKTEDLSYHKASRLSQIMMTEYKTNCTDRPGVSSNPAGFINKSQPSNMNKSPLESCKNNVEAVGRSMRKKVGLWYRRVKTPVEQLTTELGLDNIKVPQMPLRFTTRSYCSTAQPGNSIHSDHVSEDTDDAGSINQGQNEFEDLRKLVKSGGDFCKDLAVVLQERSELEAQYAKGLSKLSGKLLKASKEATGSVAHAWQAVAVQIDTQAELHRLWSTALLDEVAKPLRNSTDTQHKIRKSVEGLVEKTTRNLAEWRTAEAKSKRQCFSNSKEFEKIQESSTSLMSTANLHSTMNLSIVNGNANGTTTTNNSVLAEVRARSRILSVPPTDKDPMKLEAKRRKAEEAVRRADIEYYTFCVRSERARLEWEGAIRNGSTCLRTLEEEKLALLKELALKYFQHFNEFIPKLVRSAESLEEPIRLGSVDQDMHSVFDIRRHAGVEQLLPDFYAEDTTNLMKKERRQEALQKFIYLIRQDLEREKKGAVGIENLAKAIAEAPKVDNAHHDISDKVYYMKSMLMYLEGSKCKIENALADLEGKQRSSNSITQYMRYQRDKQGLPQTILKVPTWARDDCLNCSESTGSSSPDWTERDRGAGDGTSNRQDTDFDEFSSEESEHIEEVFDETDDTKASDLTNVPSIGRCRVIYDYDANMFDELTIRCGEMINVHDKQEDGWWLGELNGVVGIFPATYVELLVTGTDTSDQV